MDLYTGTKSVVMSSMVEEESELTCLGYLGECIPVRYDN